jgi:DNA-binding CsgD family transcriptional regulator
MELVERDSHLQTLYQAWREVREGHGRIVLVSGEAGIGKTALVQGFTRSRRSDSHLLWGGCDALFTPRPLAPLYDIAPQAPFPLLNLLDQGGDWLTVARSLLAGLTSGPTPTVMVIEDIHWADTATLDLLKFLGRRIRPTRTLLILTFRDDELTAQHPLRLVLGDLAGSGAVYRIALAGLSEDGVRTLTAGTDVDPVALHRQTNGNPFFVTEVLAGSGDIPATVRDAVLARAARLSPSGRAVLEAAAVIGGRIEPWLLLHITEAETAVIEECIASGMLQSQGDVLAFRHDLTRQVVLEAASPPRKLTLHRLALADLTGTATATQNPARLAHHAEAAGEETAVRTYALAAARQASVAHDHRQAAAQYARALRCAADLPATERAQLLEAYGQASGAIGQNEAAVAAYREAGQLRRETGETIKEGHDLSQTAQYLVRDGQIGPAIATNLQAIEILESQPRSLPLAWAYGLHSGLHMVHRDHSEAVTWGKKARASAEWFQDAEILATNYIGLGSALMLAGDAAGQTYLQRSIDLARREGLDQVTALAITNLAASAAETYQFRLADHYLAEGIPFCREREFDYYHTRLLAWQAISHLYQGRWDEAETVATNLRQRPDASAGRLEALLVLGRLHARRGTPGAPALLAEALDLANQTGLLQDVAPVRAARAEAAWLAGEPERALAEAQAIYDLAVTRQHAWFTGELAFWCWRAGDGLSLPEWTAVPFKRHIAGDWQTAAAEWERLVCPYEQAQALADGDEAGQLAALATFEELAAAPAAQTVRQKLQAAGVRGVPRGPRPATRANPLGLTPRQMEVLLLLAEGLSNSEIAGRLTLSRRTVDHHVSAILGRLELSSRAEAIALVHQLDLGSGRHGASDL